MFSLLFFLLLVKEIHGHESCGCVEYTPENTEYILENTDIFIQPGGERDRRNSFVVSNLPPRPSFPISPPSPTRESRLLSREELNVDTPFYYNTDGTVFNHGETDGRPALNQDETDDGRALNQDETEDGRTLNQDETEGHNEERPYYKTDSRALIAGNVEASLGPVESVLGLSEVEIKIFASLRGADDRCKTKCRQAQFHWHSTVDGHCACGWENATLECEEEWGPTVEVFCLQLEDEEDEALEALMLHVEEDKSTQMSSQSTKTTTSDQITTSLNSTSTTVHHATTEGGKAINNNGNKVLALVLGCACLLFLVLGALRVFFEVRGTRRKEKRSSQLKADILFNNPVSIVTRL